MPLRVSFTVSRRSLVALHLRSALSRVSVAASVSDLLFRVPPPPPRRPTYTDRTDRCPSFLRILKVRSRIRRDRRSDS